MARICIFCGSSSGNDPAYRQAAEQLGAAIGHAGHGVVYGGGRVGLMGAMADAATAAGAAVTGVITEQLVDREAAHRGISELEIVATMHARKARMAELADGVVVLPGGFGTLDEMFEILTWNQLGLVTLPVVYLDIDGYFEALASFVSGLVASGFVSAEHGRLLRRATDPDEAIALVTTTAGPIQS